jgi:hypothetical protein
MTVPAPYAKVVFITTPVSGSGGTFAKPADWNDDDNMIECIGGGASGAATWSSSIFAEEDAADPRIPVPTPPVGTPSTGQGGGGGAYAYRLNAKPPVWPVNYYVMQGGGFASSNSYFTYWDQNGHGASYNTPQSVAAAAGVGGGGAGGYTYPGTVVHPAGYAGGAGVDLADNKTGGGGGGAGGPHGAGSAATTQAGAASDGGTVPGTAVGVALPGNAGTQWDATHGTGGGASGGPATGGVGGNATGYGGGGGAGGTTGIAGSNFNGGTGFQGMIVVSWNPPAAGGLTFIQA